MKLMFQKKVLIHFIYSIDALVSLVVFGFLGSAELWPAAAELYSASIHLFPDSMETMNVNVWSFSADHRRCCWPCSQGCYLWLGSALTSGSLLVSSANQKPPCWDLGWNATSLEASAAVSLSFTPCTTAINRRIWDTVVADRGHLKYWRCVWFATFWCGGALEETEGSPRRSFLTLGKCAAHFTGRSTSALVFEEKVILKPTDFRHIPVLINHCMAAWCVASASRLWSKKDSPACGFNPTWLLHVKISFAAQDLISSAGWSWVK